MISNRSRVAGRCSPVAMKIVMFSRGMPAPCRRSNFGASVCRFGAGRVMSQTEVAALSRPRASSRGADSRPGRPAQPRWLWRDWEAGRRHGPAALGTLSRPAGQCAVVARQMPGLRASRLSLSLCSCCGAAEQEHPATAGGFVQIGLAVDRDLLCRRAGYIYWIEPQGRIVSRRQRLQELDGI